MIAVSRDSSTVPSLSSLCDVSDQECCHGNVEKPEMELGSDTDETVVYKVDNRDQSHSRSLEACTTSLLRLIMLYIPPKRNSKCPSGISTPMSRLLSTCAMLGVHRANQSDPTLTSAGPALPASSSVYKSDLPSQQQANAWG